MLESFLSHFSKKEIFVIVSILGIVTGMMIVLGLKKLVVLLWNLFIGKEIKTEG